MPEYITLSDSTFETEVLKSDLPVLVDMWAPWCGPCLIVAPSVEAIAVEQKERLMVGKLNVDDNPAVARRYGVMSIPTLLLFKNGELILRIVGALPKGEIEKMVLPHLNEG